MREEVHIPTTPDKLALLLVRDWKIEYEKEKGFEERCYSFI